MPEKRLIDANAIEAKIEKNFRRLVVNQNKPDLAAALSYVVDLIIDAPTVDAVEVVHARWENVQNGKGCCSNCHRLDSIDNLATHCRYCGARMDGGMK